MVATKSKTMGDVRFDPNFWYGEGYFNQTHGNNKNLKQTHQQKQENCIVALQYYEHGVKI